MPSMTHPTRPRHQTAPASEDVVLGVDTHKDVHVAAVITTMGALLDTRSFPTTGDGYRQLLSWAQSFGRLRRAGIECTGSYGAALTRYLHSEGVTVTEVNQPDKATRRRRGKTDAIDAAAAAQAVISGRATATAKTSDGPVEVIRMFKMARSSATKSRSQAINQLKAVLVSADPLLREALAGLSNPKLIRRCLELESTDVIAPAAAARHTLRLPARRIQHLTEEVVDQDLCQSPLRQQRIKTHIPADVFEHGGREGRSSALGRGDRCRCPNDGPLCPRTGAHRRRWTAKSATGRRADRAGRRRGDPAPGQRQAEAAATQNSLPSGSAITM